MERLQYKYGHTFPFLEDAEEEEEEEEEESQACSCNSHNQTKAKGVQYTTTYFKFSL